MKQQVGVAHLLLLCAALSSFILAVNGSPVQADVLASRGVRGGNGQLCRVKNMPACNKGLMCNVDKRCAAPGTLKQTCTTDDACNSELFCGALGHCSAPRSLGKTCTRDAQCKSKNCSTKYGRCIRAGASSTSSKPASSSTSSAATPTGTAATSSAAKAALASATPVSNSAAFTSTGLLQAPGQIKTFGSVAVVSTGAGKAIEAFAQPGKPAVLQQTLQTALSRRQQADKVFSFNYDVTAFSTSDPAAGQCSIVPSINGNQLSPPIALTSASQSGMASYHYSGAVSSYALALVCDAKSTARVQYDTVAVTPSSSGSSSSSSSTSSSSATSTSATASSSSTAVPSVTAAPLPTGACSGLDNCGFENGWGDQLQAVTSSSNGGISCSITDDPSLVHSGTYAQTCSMPDNQYATAFIDSGDSYDFAINSTYTVTFWAKFDNGANAEGLQCRVWVGYGDGGSIYAGKCPLTNAAPQNGFYQFALPFTVQDKYTSFDVKWTGKTPGTYTFDDFSVLNGTFDNNLATATPSATATYSAAPTTTAPAPTGTQNCVGITNCGFEQGTSNGIIYGFTTTAKGHTKCALTTNSSEVYSGLYAYKCLIGDTYPNTIGSLAMNLGNNNLQRNTTYDFSFWSKNNNNSAIICTNSIRNNASDIVMPVVSTAPGTNGYSRYSTSYTSDPNFGNIGDGTITCSFTNPAVYYFDNFALTPRTA